MDVAALLGGQNAPKTPFQNPLVAENTVSANGAFEQTLKTAQGGLLASGKEVFSQPVGSMSAINLYALGTQPELPGLQLSEQEARALAEDFLASPEAQAMDLSLFDREKIVQMLLGIEPEEEKPAEGEAIPEKIEADSVAEAILQSQQNLMDTDDTLDLDDTLIDLAANDNAPQFGYLEAPVTLTNTARAQEVVMSIAVGAVLRPVQNPSGLTNGASASTASSAFTDLLEGAYQPIEAGNAQLEALQNQARNNTIHAVNGTAKAAENATAPVVQASPLQETSQAALSDTLTEAVDAATPEQQRIEQVSQNVQQNNAQHHSADAASRAHEAASRYITLRPGADVGGASEQVSVSIRQGMADGSDRILVQLDPADLGRVEVRIEMNDGRAQVMVVAERRETLQQLQADARALEQALAQAGIQAETSGMEFQLGGGAQQQDGEGDESLPNTGFTRMETLDTLQPAAQSISGIMNVQSGLNITV